MDHHDETSRSRRLISGFALTAIHAALITATSAFAAMEWGGGTWFWGSPFFMFAFSIAILRWSRLPWDSTLLRGIAHGTMAGFLTGAAFAATRISVAPSDWLSFAASGGAMGLAVSLGLAALFAFVGLFNWLIRKEDNDAKLKE